MPTALSKTVAVAQRVLRQLAHDRRFLGLSLVAPIILIAVLKIFWVSMGPASQSLKSPPEALKQFLETLAIPSDKQQQIGAELSALLGQPQKPTIESGRGS